MPRRPAKIKPAAPDTAPVVTPDRLDSPSLFLNRELAVLEFHRRVLAQALDPEIPLLERLRFLTISCSNLDEFFEIRFPALKEQVVYGVAATGPDGLAAEEVVRRVSAVAHDLVAEQYRVFQKVLLPELDAQGIRILRRQRLTARQRTWVRDYFRREVLPVLTPVGLDPAHPFPPIVNKSLNFIVALEGKDAFGRNSGMAVVQAPRALPRLIALPAAISRGPHEFILLSSVIHANVGELFPGMAVTECRQFRLTRDSDLWVNKEEVDDLLQAVKGELRRRNWGDSVRLEIADETKQSTAAFLLEQFKLTADDLYRVPGPVNLHRVAAVYDAVDRPDLKYPPFTPRVPRGLQADDDIFEALRERDVLLHHPYESFSPVIELVRQAARDPDVLAIKQTVYRTGTASPIVDALVAAARAGKEVTAVVELRARFDEAANIDIAMQLQEAGAKVVYGIVGYKTHAKMLLIVRREGAALRRYVHVGTGNYHPKTTRAYTDFSLLSANPKLGEDVHRLFQMLTGLGKLSELNYCLHSPFTLHQALLRYIDREVEEARAGRPARITARMNALTEPVLIQALYAASRAGVEIDLIVRGMCCLRPGVPGVSERIRVRSVIGRFLEHSRVFRFYHGGRTVTLLSSADWMERNMFRRVEAAFPVLGEKIAKRVNEEGLDRYLTDDSQAWLLQPDGSYIRAVPADAGRRRCAQAELSALLAG